MDDTANCADDADLSYQQVLIAEFHHQVKLFVDWFIVRYEFLIEKRCKIAARRFNIYESWEELKQITTLECYEIALRFDPNKGDILTYLISSIWMFPLRNDIINRVKPLSQLKEEDYIPNKQQDFELKHILDNIPSFYANYTPKTVHSFEAITDSLTENDKMLLVFHFELGLPNTKIAAMVGIAESTIRARLHAIITKLKIRWKNDEQTFYPDEN